MELKVEGLTPAVSWLGQLVLDIPRSINSGLSHIADLELKDTIARYNAEKDPDGNKWKPLAPSTIARKRSKGQSLSILKASEYMFNTLYTSEGKDEIYIGTKASYGFVHQNGKGKVPQRQFLGVSEQKLQQYTDILANYTANTIQ